MERVIEVLQETKDQAKEQRQFVIKNNPQAKIFTNQEVAQELVSCAIACELLEHNQSIVVKEVVIEGCGQSHAVIYTSLPILSNTGYLINNRLFIPGDAFTVPSKPVEILALPVCAPWSKVAEVIDYAKQVGPKIVFPIHDGMLKITGGFHWLPSDQLPQANIEWKVIEDGHSLEV
jgi:L-ascorbate metabolism protein UlaG (beta-lactamase superfamily)